MAQHGSNNGSKMVPKCPQVGPKTAPTGPQEGTKNYKNTKTRHVGPQEAKTPKSPHLLGPKLDPKLTHFGQMLVTFCQHVYEDVSSSIFDGFWEASIVFDPQNLPKIDKKVVPGGLQEALERLQKSIQKKVFHFTQTSPYDLPGGLPDSPPRAHFRIIKNNYRARNKSCCYCC